jgi:hypothetical protein
VEHHGELVLLIEDKNYFDVVVEHAKKLGMYDKNDETNGTLASRLEYLEKYGGDKMRVKLFKDFAPFSFGFVIEQRHGDGWQHLFTGGLIFHGPHDALGSGSGPTFSSTVTPTSGWSIHT